MVKNLLRVVIDNTAKASLAEAYRYIKQESEKSAAKIRDKILASIQALADNPHRHAPDKYRLNNDGAYRAYEVNKYRITYLVSSHQVAVLRIRHTKMSPKTY